MAPSKSTKPITPTQGINQTSDQDNQSGHSIDAILDTSSSSSESDEKVLTDTTSEEDPQSDDSSSSDSDDSSDSESETGHKKKFKLTPEIALQMLQSRYKKYYDTKKTPTFNGSSNQKVITQFINDFKSHCKQLGVKSGSCVFQEIKMALEGTAVSWWDTEWKKHPELTVKQFCSLVQHRYMPADYRTTLIDELFEITLNPKNIRESILSKEAVYKDILDTMTAEEIITTILYNRYTPTGIRKHFNLAKDLKSLKSFADAYHKNFVPRNALKMEEPRPSYKSHSYKNKRTKSPKSVSERSSSSNRNKLAPSEFFNSYSGKNKLRCSFCQKVGHEEKYCFMKKKDENTKKVKDQH